MFYSPAKRSCLVNPFLYQNCVHHNAFDYGGLLCCVCYVLYRRIGVFTSAVVLEVFEGFSLASTLGKKDFIPRLVKTTTAGI